MHQGGHQRNIYFCFMNSLLSTCHYANSILSKNSVSVAFALPLYEEIFFG